MKRMKEEKGKEKWKERKKEKKKKAGNERNEGGK